MIKLEAWPRADGLIEVECGLSMWRGTPAEAKVYIEGMKAGLAIGATVAKDALVSEFVDRRFPETGK